MPVISKKAINYDIFPKKVSSKTGQINMPCKWLTVFFNQI